MGFFTNLPGNRPDESDDMLFYLGDATADGNDVAMDLTVRRRTSEPSVILIETDSDVNPVNTTDEIKVISSPSVISGDSSMRMEQRKRRTYRCRKCGDFKKGHICPMNSSTSSQDSSVTEKPSEGSSRAATNRLNLTRLAQRVEGDNSADPDWVAPGAINVSPTRISPRRRPQRRTVAAIAGETDENVAPPRKIRKLHECRNCHVPMKGHKCQYNKLISQQMRQLGETTRVMLNRVD